MTNQRAFFIDENTIQYQKYIEKNKRVRKRSAGASRKKGTTTSKTKNYTCAECGLRDKCISPELPRYGKGEKDILVIGQAPGETEDIESRPFVGASGQLLRDCLEAIGFDLDRDCVTTNVVKCRPTKKIRKYGRTYVVNRPPTNNEIRCCRSKLLHDIEETKPKLIICLGNEAIGSVISCKSVGSVKVGKLHGLVFPNHDFNCWTGAAFHPSSIIREEGQEGIFIEDLVASLSKLDASLPQPLDRNKYELISDSDKAITLLEELSRSIIPVAFDYETTCTSAYASNARILTVNLATDPHSGICIPLVENEWNDVEQAYVYDELRKFIISDAPKVVQNYNMEETWSRKHVGASINNLVSDTMVTHHVINCRGGTTSLDFQVHHLTGDDYKGMVKIDDMENEPLEKVAQYGVLDARYTIMSHDAQRKILSQKSMQRVNRFDRFFRSALHVLANLKHRGVRIDVDILNGFEVSSTEKIEAFREKVKLWSFTRAYEKKYEKEINIDSSAQIATLLYDIHGISSTKKTSGGGRSVDKEALSKIKDTIDDKDVVGFITELQQYKKSFSMIKKVKEYQRLLGVDGRIHPSYNLNIAETYRSSASGPNSQNVYAHDEELGVFRTCIVPSEDNVFLEVDYDGVEVRGIAMHSGDEILAQQIKDGVDTHKLWASRLERNKIDDVTKEQRFVGKNKFVFPSFYGAQPASIARNTNKKESFIEEVQELFWKEYAGVKSWQEKSLAFYEKYNYLEGLTGFRRYGPLSIEKIYNTPNQGASFHLLLDALIRIDAEMVSRKMKSQAIVEVHDSILFDMCPDEIEEVVELATEILISKRFDWQRDVPLSVTWEIGENWYEMEEL